MGHSCLWSSGIVGKCIGMLVVWQSRPSFCQVTAVGSRRPPFHQLTEHARARFWVKPLSNRFIYWAQNVSNATSSCSRETLIQMFEINQRSRTKSPFSWPPPLSLGHGVPWVFISTVCRYQVLDSTVLFGLLLLLWESDIPMQVSPHYWQGL